VKSPFPALRLHPATESAQSVGTPARASAASVATTGAERPANFRAGIMQIV
jgi:hypothetical protein